MGLNSSDEGQQQEQARREHFAFLYWFMAKFTSIVSEWNYWLSLCCIYLHALTEHGRQVYVAELRAAQRGEIEVQDKEKGSLFSNLYATALANK